MSIGWRPIYEVINLNKGDFVYSRTSPKALPPGTTAEIVWANGVTWLAEVDGNTVSWAVTGAAAGAAAVPHGTAYDKFIVYPTGESTSQRFHWKTGRADRVPADE